MLVLGLGNLTGNIFGPRIVNKIGYNLSFYGGIIFTAVLYVLLPHVKNIVLVELSFFALFFLDRNFVCINDEALTKHI